MLTLENHNPAYNFVFGIFAVCGLFASIKTSTNLHRACKGCSYSTFTYGEVWLMRVAVLEINLNFHRRDHRRGHVEAL